MYLSKTSRRLHGTDNTIRLEYRHDVPYRDESFLSQKAVGHSVDRVELLAPLGVYH